MSIRIKEIVDPREIDIYIDVMVKSGKKILFYMFFLIFNRKYLNMTKMDLFVFAKKKKYIGIQRVERVEIHSKRSEGG